MGNQYPVIVSDTREARRGSVTLMTRNLGQYNALRRIVFPASGRIRPVLVQSGGDPALLLDDMRIIPLDVEVEQATQANADLRYVHHRLRRDRPVRAAGRPGRGQRHPGRARRTPTSPSPTPPPPSGQWVTLTDTSTGTGDDWEWTIEAAAADNKVGKFYTAGPAQGPVRWAAARRRSSSGSVGPVRATTPAPRSSTVH